MDPESLDPRTQRILEAAVELAERDGFEAVRLRDLAAKADVALGTVYRRFASKEDILAAALELQVTQMRAAIQEHPIQGDTAEERLAKLFEMTTQALAANPKLAAAMLRTVASGVPELSEKVLRYHGAMTDIILGVYRGSFEDSLPSQKEQDLAHLLQNVWFATLVGWTGGLHDVDTVLQITNRAAHLLIKGLEAE